MSNDDAGKVLGVSPPDGSRRAVRQPSNKDIARLAHVSHPTVSRALQNSPLVNPLTAERIRKIAEQAGYHASAVARGLVTRHNINLIRDSLEVDFLS